MAFSNQVIYVFMVVVIGANDAITVTVTLPSTATITGKSTNTPHGDAGEFLGIPYAKPPVGGLRFKPPQMHPEDWSGALDASQYGAVCKQELSLWLPIFGLVPPNTVSEDCLFLNVHVPGRDIDLSNKKAVMVGIHGGGFAAGASQMYYGNNMAVLGDVIIVTINYRLNIFGFFTTGSDTIPGNMGLMDMNLALQWIQRNIEAFGGDKARVTIFGESAGGFGVSAQVLSPKSRGLFHKAISMSGVLADERVLPKEDFHDKTAALIERVGCLYENADAMVKCLQDASTDQIDILSQGVFYQVVVDGDNGFLPLRIREILARNQYNAVDFMAGVMQEDGVIFLGMRTNMRSAFMNGIDANEVERILDTSAWNKTLSGPSIKTLVREKYFPELKNPWSNLRGMVDLLTDDFILASTMIALDAISVANPSYLYHFRQSGPATVNIPAINFGPAHTEELPFLFDTLINASDDAVEVSRSMIHAWATFAKNEGPQYLGANNMTLEWPQYNKDTRKYVEFKASMGEDSVKERLLSSRVSFWNDIVPTLIDFSICQEDNPSLISRQDAETALFMLILVTVSLLLVIVIVIANRK